LNAEATRASRTLDHFQIPATLGKTKLRQLLSSVGGICPDLFEAWQQWGESGKQAPGAFTIVQIGRSDVDRQQEAKRINENVALASLDMLVGVKPADAG
jgi:hypothetical protein